MDATVPQADGFRFVYVLPLAEDRVLVEDTYFSDTDLLEREALRERALAYAQEKGLSPVLGRPRGGGRPAPALGGPAAAPVRLSPASPATPAASSTR